MLTLPSRRRRARILSALAALCLGWAAADAQIPDYALKTIAGTPQAGNGSVDGVGLAARFSGPSALAYDPAGNLYVADTGNHTIRKITPAGAVTTVAGQPGIHGFADGPAATALFWSPQGIAVDAAGNVFVSDYDNSRIRKLSPDGTVTTIAGSGAYGHADGNGAAATFSGVKGMAIDGAGDLFVADVYSNTIRRVAPNGDVTTVVDSTTPAGGRPLSQPVGVAVDSSGALYIADAGAIRKFSGGVLTTLAEIYDVFGANVGVGGSGNVFVSADKYLYEITPDGRLHQIAGSNPTSPPYYQDGTGPNAVLRSALGLAVRPNGQVALTDPVADTILTGAPDLNYPVAPVLSYPAVPNTVLGGSSVTLSIGIMEGYPTPTYQWYRAGQPISGATSSSYTFTAEDGANPPYYVVVSNGSSSVQSITFQLYGNHNGPPVINAPPRDVTVAAGGTAQFYISTTTSAQIQWYFKSAPIAGATANLLTLNQVTPDEAGTYEAVATDAFGSSSASANLTVTGGSGAPPPAAGPSFSAGPRLINLSARAYSNNGAESLTAGFVIGGSGGSTKPLLLRGIGPSLAQYGVTSPVAKAALTLFRSDQTPIYTNDGWGADALLASTANTVGAFALAPNSGDSAIVWALYPGLYTMQVTDDTGAGGNALAEIYDVNANDPATRLLNLSARGKVSSTTSLVGGFVISGTGAETVLIRGVGPALAGYNVPNALSAGTLTLFDSKQAVLAQNTGWVVTASINGNSVSLPAVFSQVGAFALPPGSADCALLVSLPPGLYTAQLTPAPGSSGGIGLIEIYEVASP